MKLRKSIVMAAGGFSLLAVALGAPAMADTNVGNATTLAGVGSDTSQDVVEGLSNVIQINGQPVISNYKATPNPEHSITTRTGVANCTFNAPANSGEGRDALSAAVRGASYGGSSNLAGCVDFARSSSGGNPTISPGVGSLTYIPFATDAVTFATLNVTNVGHKLQKSDLVAIYTANTGSCVFAPLLPKQGSGTRTFFLQQLGLSDVAIGAAGGPGTCVKDTINGAPIEENDGRALTNGDNLIPFSVAQYVAQSSDATNNVLGRATLGAVDGTNTGNFTAPVSLKTTFPFNRPIYNVVPTARTTDNSTTQQTFVGANSLVCQQTTLIQLYGFAPNASCGDTSKKNTN